LVVKLFDTNIIEDGIRIDMKLVVGQLHCAVSGHVISAADEVKLRKEAEFDTLCPRCHYPIHIVRDGENFHKFTIMEY
jgi:Zn finger protein HypA/HybF involved in hydrogenase expression